MFCAKCGAKVEDGTSFCGKCGAKIAASGNQGASNASTNASPAGNGRANSPAGGAAPSNPGPNKGGIGIVPVIIAVIAAVAILFVIIRMVAPKDKETDREDEVVQSEEKKDEDAKAEKADEKASSENKEAVSSTDGKEVTVVFTIADAANEENLGASLTIIRSGEEGNVFESSAVESGSTDISLTPGEYTAICTMDGYEELEQAFTVEEGADASEVKLLLGKSAGPAYFHVESASSEEPLEGVRVRLEDGDGNMYEGFTDEEGTAAIEGLKNEGYDVSYTKDTFFSADDHIDYKAGDEYLKALAPVMEDEIVMVMLEWTGDADLDLCIYNAGSNQAVNKFTPTEEEGDNSSGNFLYADHGSGKGYEVAVIRSKDMEVPQTVYVVDFDQAKAGADSDFLGQGVKVTVYDKNGAQIYQAPKDMSAPVWQACYYYAGERYTEDAPVVKEGEDATEFAGKMESGDWE